MPALAVVAVAILLFIAAPASPISPKHIAIFGGLAAVVPTVTGSFVTSISPPVALSLSLCVVLMVSMLLISTVLYGTVLPKGA